MADEVIEMAGPLAAVHESGFGTNRPFYACRRMSVLGGKAVMQRTSPQRPILTPMVFGSIHRTCLSPLVTDRVSEAWYLPPIA